MSDNFFELVPAIADPAEKSAFSSVFTHLHDEFFASPLSLDHYSKSKTIHLFHARLKEKQPHHEENTSLCDCINTFFWLISDREFLFAQARERGELIGCCRSHRAYHLNRSAVLDNLRRSGSTPAEFRRKAIERIQWHLIDESPREWGTLSKERQKQLLTVLSETVEFCRAKNHKVYQLYLPYSNDEVYPEPARLSAALHKLSVQAKPVFCTHARIHGSFPELYTELLVHRKISRTCFLMDGKNIPIREFLSKNLPSSQRLNRRQLELLVFDIFPLYIREERANAELHKLNQQQNKLSTALSAAQFQRFEACKASFAALKAQWDAAVAVLSQLRPALALILEDSSRYDSLPPLARLIYDHCTPKLKNSMNYSVDILIHANLLSRPEWHKQRPMQRYAALVNDLAQYMQEQNFEPWSPEWIAQIDALLLFTGFHTFALQHPKALNMSLHKESWLSSELLIRKVYAAIKECVSYDITDCLSFDPTILSRSAVKQWLKQPYTSLAALGKAALTDRDLKQYRRLFESPKTSRAEIRQFLEKLYPKFDWTEISLPTDRRFAKKHYRTGLRYLLIEYTLLQRLAEESRSQLRESFCLLCNDLLVQSDLANKSNSQ